jgi:diaminopimelate epimerase
MSESRFYKMTGSGNDFVFLDGRNPTRGLTEPAGIRGLCDRRTGVGADGVVVLSPETGGARMVYYNADGSRAGMCGNAALCSTRLAVHLEITSSPEMQLHTDTGILKTRCVGPGWAAELLLPDFELPRPTGLGLLPGEAWMDFCSVGVPHVEILVEDVTQADVTGRGRALRWDPAFPDGANVNFIGPVRDPEAPAPWRLRTWERGVEAETLACGTGTVGAAAALAARGLTDLPVRISSWGGNVFSVAGRIDGGWLRDPWLCGEGRLVFVGVLASSQ